MQTFEAIRKRTSVREFEPKAISKQDLVKLIDAARLAPTARNEQPWQFVVITNPDLKQKIAGLAPNGQFIKNAPVCVAILSRETKYYLEDCSAATTTLLLAAVDLGIGACWVAGDKKDYCSAVLSLIKAPAGLKLVSLIALGIAKGKVNKPLKKEVEQLLSWESMGQRE